MAPLSSVWRRRAFWALWALVAFGWLNVQALPERRIEPASSAPPGLSALLVLMRNDGDTRRYFAYANAILGRSYDGYFVHPPTEAADAAPAKHELVAPSRPLLPWRDFGVEYPPGVLVAVLPPALLTDDFRVYHVLFGIEMELLLTIAVGLAVATADRFDFELGARTLQLSVMLLAALGVIGARRYDGLVSLCLAASAYALTLRRAGAAGGAIAAAIVAKGAPVLLAPIGLLHIARTQGIAGAMRAMAGAAAVLGLAAGAYFALAGGNGFDALTYHADRPIQIESPYGAALLVGLLFDPGLIKVVYSFGSHNVEASFEPALRKLSFVLTVTALVAIVAVYARGLWRLAAQGEERAQLQLTLAASVGMLAAFIMLGKVFSPQYLTWLLPLGVLAAALGSQRSCDLLFMGVFAGQLEYPFIYHTAGRYAFPALGAISLVRFALIAATSISLLYDAYPRQLPLPALKERNSWPDSDGHS